MRKLRLVVGRRNHHHLRLKWTFIFIILSLWITMSLAIRRSQQQESYSSQDNIYPSPSIYQNQRIPVSSPSPRPPLSLNLNSRRNALKDRLYYNPLPPPEYNPPQQQRRTDRNSNQDHDFLLRPQNESPMRQPMSSISGSAYPSPGRRGTSTSSSSPAVITSHLDNSLSNKLLDFDHQNQFIPLPSSRPSGGGSDNRRRNFNSNVNSGSGGGNSKKQRKKSYPPRSASVNSILRLDPGQSYSVWDEAAAVCRSIPGLTREQMELCFKNPDATKVALQGLSLAADECAYQMSKNRWNCSSLQGRLNPHSTVLFKKGYRESAFGHAIASAGVAYSVSKACSQGNLLSCGCGFQYDDQVNFIPSKDADYAFDESNESSVKRWTSGGGKVKQQQSNSVISSSWKWSGCSHNMDYGIKFAKLFLDSRERSSDLPSRINLHNNRVGRSAVSTNMEVRCKCHGLSGSCELRTCWRSAPEFRQVGTVLKNKFRRAVMIDQSELGNRPLNRVHKMKKQTRRKRRDRAKRNSGAIDLWYYERSPTYCESNSDFSIPGTTGRVCNKTQGGREMGSCSTLCCGRGYNTIRQVYTTRCQCQFIWCCEVTCKNCTVDEYITVCK